MTNYPNSPAVNDTFTSEGVTWKWDGTAWVLFTPIETTDVYVSRSGDTMTGNLIMAFPNKVVTNRIDIAPDTETAPTVISAFGDGILVTSPAGTNIFRATPGQVTTVSYTQVDGDPPTNNAGINFFEGQLRLFTGNTSAHQVDIYIGEGSPNGVVSADPPAIYFNTEGGAGATLWVKESGVGTDTGWVAK